MHVCILYCGERLYYRIVLRPRYALHILLLWKLNQSPHIFARIHLTSIFLSPQDCRRQDTWNTYLYSVSCTAHTSYTDRATSSRGERGADERFGKRTNPMRGVLSLADSGSCLFSALFTSHSIQLTSPDKADSRVWVIHGTYRGPRSGECGRGKSDRRRG